MMLNDVPLFWQKLDRFSSAIEAAGQQSNSSLLKAQEQNLPY